MKLYRNNQRNFGKLPEKIRNELLLKLGGEGFNIWLHKGYAFDKLEEYEEAIKCYNKASEIDANNACAWYNRACCKVKKNDIDNGFVDLKKSN